MTVFNFQYSDLILKIGGQILFIIIVLLVILSETSILQSPLNIFKKYGTSAANVASALSKASASGLASTTASSVKSASTTASGSARTQTSIQNAKSTTSALNNLNPNGTASLIPGSSATSAIFKI